MDLIVSVLEFTILDDKYLLLDAWCNSLHF